MKICLGDIPQKLKTGIKEHCLYGFFEENISGYTICAQKGDDIVIEKTKDSINITYDEERHFYMALARASVMKNGKCTIKPQLKELGIMLDCSRNAVPTVEALKKYICMMSLAGYTYLELYTEDTYELQEEPYFGYMRGRFSEKEIKEIVSFAKNLQVQIVPCIQTLAHLSRLENWLPYARYMDIDGILQVDDERTYDLIRKMLSYAKATYETKRINIGMDEAFRIGRGKYLDRKGYCDKDELFYRHIKRVFAICKELDIEPEFWDDGLRYVDLSNGKIKELFDGTQTPVYWDYYCNDSEVHKKFLQHAKEYAGRVVYAGGTWNWPGFAPANYYAKGIIDAAMKAVRECNVDNILMTNWGENGTESSMFVIMPIMWYVANMIYPADVSYSEILKSTTGYTEEEWLLCDELNKTYSDQTKIGNAAKYMFYNDFLNGLLDYHIPNGINKRFEDLTCKFKALARRRSSYSYIFEFYYELSNTLIQKAEIGKKLYEAYHKDDKNELKHLVDEVSIIKRNVERFQKSFHKMWLQEYKDCGMEVCDVRIGGVINRANTVIELLRQYLQGDIEKIYALEQERLDYFGEQLKEKTMPLHNVWRTIITTNYL